MALQTDHNTINHIADGATFNFPYDFRVDQASDMVVLFDSVPQDPGLVDEITGIGNDDGGAVIFLVEPIVGVIVTLARIVPSTQELVYPAYGPFPAKSHEQGLDKLTMLNQQNAERVTSSVRMPLGDDASVVLPNVADRAHKYLLFDDDGNVSVGEIVDSEFALLDVDVTLDSRTMLDVDKVQAQHPEIRVLNPGTANALLQLNGQGKVPFANMGFGGIAIRGPLRGDNLCPKEGDLGPECTAPDYRNPSERFPDLVPTAPFEVGKFSTGDMFLLTFQDPEVDGNMNLFSERGGVETPLAVGQRDSVVFLSGWDIEGEDIPDVTQGWYHLPKLYDVGDANSITFSPSLGYILSPSHNNVQLALDYINQNAVDIQNRDQTIGGIKQFTLAPRTANTPQIDNDVTRKGYVDDAIATSIAAALLTLYPVGSYKIGPDPTAVVGGTWELLPEGTFLMNTVGGDASGGQNSKTLVTAEMPSHNHTSAGLSFAGTALAAHNHLAGISQANDLSVRYGYQIGGGSNTSYRMSAASGTTNGHNFTESKGAGTPAGNINGSVALNGSGQAFDNRPVYRGVPIWYRTA